MIKKLKLNLRLFDGEAGFAAAPAAGETANAQSGNAAAPPWHLLKESKADRSGNGGDDEINRGQSNDRQHKENAVPDSAEAHDAGEDAGSSKGADRKEKFKELVKGEYKNEYSEAVENAVKRRMSKLQNDNKALSENLRKFDSLLDFLSAKYGNDSSDIDGIVTAVMEDDSFIRQQALDNGLTVEQQRQQILQAQETARLQRENEAFTRAAQQQQLINNLRQQEQQLKQIYPQFDLSSELDDEKFCATLAFTRGLNGGKENLQQAYEMTHIDDLKNQAIVSTAKQVKSAVTDSIVARQYLPRENGTGGRAATPIKTARTSFSDEELTKFARMAHEGKDISKYINNV